MASNAAHYPAPPGYASSSYQAYPPVPAHRFPPGPQPSFLHGNGVAAGPHRAAVAASLTQGERRSSGGSSEGSRRSPDQNLGEKQKGARFGGGALKTDYQEERSKILTMKYGKQQMMLIRKRLKVEMWLMDELETLFEDEDLAVKCDMDIDNILDLETDAERRDAIVKKLSGCPANQQDTEEFIKNFLERLCTL